MTILELREKRAKAWEAAKAFLDSRRNDKGILSAEDDRPSGAAGGAGGRTEPAHRHAPHR